ncbi:MAG: T9SS type A sorting domain-containing protein, partial [Candidatus Eisenbacteria bacterium]
AVTFPSGTAVYATGILPPAVDPWQKRLVYDDMPSAPEPPYGVEASLPDIEENFTVFKVPISGDEYLLLENRLDDINGNGQLQITRDPATGVILGPAGADTLEYDFLVPGPGVLAWHVDESVADFFGPRADPGYGLNVNRSRFGLQIEEADGLDDLGDFNSPYALGATTDPWSDSSGGRFNDTTFPRLLTNSETDPHLDIEFTSPPGPVMTVRVTRQWDLAGWPAHVVQPPAGISPVISPLGAGPQVRIAWAGGDSAVHVRNVDGTPTVPGASDDIVLRASAPLRQVSVVTRDPVYGGPFLAVAEDAPDPIQGGATGMLHLIRFTADGHVASIQDVVQPAPVTAGPATQPPVPANSSGLPAPVFTGLSNGKVICNVFTGTPGAETVTPVLVRTIAGRVTGLAVSGEAFYAGSDAGEVGYPGGVVSGVAPAGHALQPLLYTVRELACAAPCTTFENVAYVAVVDKTAGEFRRYLTTGFVMTPDPLDQLRPLGEPINAPALDDIDADGRPEILFTTVSGKVGYWNDNGSLSPGWPPRVEREGFATKAGPLPLTRPGASSLVLASLGNGRLTALDAERKAPKGFPLGLSVGARGTGALDTGLIYADGPPVLIIAGGDGLLYGIALLNLGTQGQAAVSTWGHEGGTPGRGYASDRLFGTDVSVTASATPILPGTFKCYPNPARQAPVTFAFRLREAARVTIKIYDPAARLVDEMARDASASDNAISWDPGARPSGLYVARVEAAGQVVTQPFAVLR